MNIMKRIAVVALALLSSASFAGERVKLFDYNYTPQGCKQGEQETCFNPNNKRANELFAQGRFDELTSVCNDIGYYHHPKVGRDVVEQCAKMGNIRMMGWLAYVYRTEGNYGKAVVWALHVTQDLPSKERYPSGAVAPQKESRVAWGELCYASLYGKGMEQSFDKAAYYCGVASSRYQDSEGVGLDERYNDVTLVWYKESLKGFYAVQHEREELRRELILEQINENNARSVRGAMGLH
jgi:hypothetical protein